jgi:hypothetical protein
VWGGCPGWLEHGEHFWCEVAFAAADDLVLGLALRQPSGQVVLGWLVVAQPHQHDAVQCGVGLAVPTPVDSLGRLRCQGAWLTMPLEFHPPWLLAEASPWRRRGSTRMPAAPPSRSSRYPTGPVGIVGGAGNESRRTNRAFRPSTLTWKT